MRRFACASELLIKIDRADRLSLRAQLERELRRAIQSGRLRAGSPLPATRTLAADLGLSRGVVVEAYEQLVSEGYVLAERGSVTRVASRAVTCEDEDEEPAREPPAPAFRYDLRPGLPDLGLFPRREWLLSMSQAIRGAGPGALDYPDPRGAEPARRELAAYLNRVRATRARSDHIVFSGGSAQGITLICRALLARGMRRLAVEDPGHADQCTDIQAVGLETPRIPVDEEGIVVERLSETGADAVLVTPAHQYPTGAVLSPDRRAALLHWAARRGAVIIEDDYDAEYRYDREPIGALQGLAPERVAYVGSASKTLSPALRIGWVVAPADLLPDVARLKFEADRGSPGLELMAFGDFLARGQFDRHLRHTRRTYRQRRNALVAALRQHLPSLTPRGVAAGLHLMLELPERMDEDAAVAEAAHRSIRVYGARSYHARPDCARPALLIGYGGLPESRIRPAVAQLAEAFAKGLARRSRP
jgi:GntR family transcriptional regulator/MocR family aminotransferase